MEKTTNWWASKFVLFTKSGGSRWLEHAASTSESQSDENQCKDVWEEMTYVTVQRNSRYVMRKYLVYKGVSYIWMDKIRGWWTSKFVLFTKFCGAINSGSNTCSIHSGITKCVWKPVEESAGGTDIYYTNQTKITSDKCSVHGFCDDCNEHLDFGILNWQCVDCYEITIYYGIFLMLSAQLC
jgi:hypothetical protein